MQELNPYESSEQSDKSKHISVGAKQKKGLGLYDLAALVFVVALLILLLTPAFANKGVLFGGIILSSGVLFVIGAFVAGIAFKRRRL